jgi:2-oxoglutarate ferredoxin oxidoreductase subunit alpha
LTINKIQLDKAVIRFAGDSGDGIQLIGSEFTNTTALAMNDLGTFPDFPAEIRAPVGTVAGVSGFQIQFSSDKIYSSGDLCDTLVVMNAAALKKNLTFLKKGGVIIANEDGFDSKNLRLAKIEEENNPLKNDELSNYQVYVVPITNIVKEALKDQGLGTKEAERSKNMFVLGLLYWMYNRKIGFTTQFIERKFSKYPDIAKANINTLLAGYNYGETAEIFHTTYEIGQATFQKGTYRNITGNVATAYGLIAAAQKAELPLYYGTYPITPASDILHELAKHKSFGVMTFQAEDEISAVTSAIGASYAGAIGVTASSGPGIDLKSEAMGLAMMLELPMVVIDVQRAGPSTGMPTKTEQADLLLAMYGRHGESPMPIIAAQSPTDAFMAVYEAMKISIEWMTPVFFLSDGYIANGSEPWNIPHVDDLPSISKHYATDYQLRESKYMPYQRDARLVRTWALPGVKGFENRIGGIEKEDVTGNISYEAKNHEKMTQIRAQKVENIAQYISPLKIETGKESGKVLVLGWGGTFGILKTAVTELINEGFDVSQAHLRWLNPFPANIKEVMDSFEYVIVPEINTGQLSLLLRAKYLKDIIKYNKVQGLPFNVQEIKDKVMEVITKV